MIGLQQTLINNNIAAVQLSQELGIANGTVSRWFLVDKVPKRYLDILSKKFNISKEYINKKVNDASTYLPKFKGFNDYKTFDEYTILYLTRKNGDVLECFIDSDELEKVKLLNLRFTAKWEKKSQTFYASAMYKKENGKKSTIMLHNIIMDTSEIIHHKDHNGINNRKENLQIKTNQENLIERRGANPNNKLGVRNVFFDERSNKYIVQLQVDGKNTRLGKFKTLEEADVFAQEMREKYYKIKEIGG